jgi:enoyl-CoA hydratase
VLPVVRVDDFDRVLFTVEDRVATVALNRPEVHNAFDLRQRAEVVSAFAAVADAGDEVRCIVLRGVGGRAFSAGQDIREVAATPVADVARGIRETWAPLYQAVGSSPVPVIASLQGYALGAGFQLAMCADIRVAATSAVFGLSEIDIGLPAITGVTILRDHVGMGLIKYLVLTGTRLTAQEALAHGLVALVVDDADLAAETQRLALDIAAKDPFAVRMNKLWWDQLTSGGLRHGEQYAQVAHPLAYESGSATERISAFLQPHSSGGSK